MRKELILAGSLLVAACGAPSPTPKETRHPSASDQGPIDAGVVTIVDCGKTNNGEATFGALGKGARAHLKTIRRDGTSFTLMVSTEDLPDRILFSPEDASSKLVDSASDGHSVILAPGVEYDLSSAGTLPNGSLGVHVLATCEPN